MQRITDVIQMNKRKFNYIVKLNCGHSVALFSTERPKKTDYECPICSYARATAGADAEEQREQSGGAL